MCAILDICLLLNWQSQKDQLFQSGTEIFMNIRMDDHAKLTHRTLKSNFKYVMTLSYVTYSINNSYINPTHWIKVY